MFLPRKDNPANTSESFVSEAVLEAVGPSSPETYPAPQIELNLTTASVEGVAAPYKRLTGQQMNKVGRATQRADPRPGVFRYRTRYHVTQNQDR